jgi:hypothetical protein
VLFAVVVRWFIVTQLDEFMKLIVQI